MSTLKIYHNPRCSKSRQTLELLLNRGLQPEVIDYLKHPPSASELEEVLNMLKLKPEELVRTKEAVFTELGLKGKNLSHKEWIQIFIQNPILLERPIVVHHKKAALGRPPEKVLEIL